MAEPGPDRFERAVAAIDEANSEDPEHLSIPGGEPRPKELVHAELVTGWVRRLDPEADEAQLLAARAHHFRRWTMPRDAYPEGRDGYLRWRAAAKRRHAEEVGALLGAHGYDDATIEQVARIVRKDGRRTDARVQTHEDALCLVFLQTQLADVAARLGPEASLRVLRRTLDKMSDRAIELALGLELDEGARELLEGALAREPEGAAPPQRAPGPGAAGSAGGGSVAPS